AFAGGTAETPGETPGHAPKKHRDAPERRRRDTREAPERRQRSSGNHPRGGQDAKPPRQRDDGAWQISVSASIARSALGPAAESPPAAAVRRTTTNRSS